MAHSLTYNDMLGAYAPYPAPIRPYLLRAATHPLFTSLLTKSFMRVFIDILGRAPIADPSRPLKLRVDVVADKLDISTKTVTRTIRFLQNRGWLSHHVDHDGRNHQGEFCAREFILGVELRHLLGLPTSVRPQNDYTTLTENTDTPLHQDSAALPYPAETLITISEPWAAPIATATTFTPETAIITASVTQPESLSAAPNRLINEQEPVTDALSNPTPILLETPDAEDLNTKTLMDEMTTGTKMSHGLYIGVNKIFLKEASFKEDAFQIKNQKTNTASTFEHHREANIDIITHNEFSGPLQMDPAASDSSTSAKQPKLPADLVEMANTLQLSPWGICALMRLAKQMNQRLQDVWHAKREQILNAQATGGRAYRYIQFLLQTGEDFVWRARQSMLPKAPASTPPVSGATSRTTDNPEETEHLMYRNKRFLGNNGVQVFVQNDGSATFSSPTQSNIYVCPADMGQIYEAIKVGKLWQLDE